MESWQLILGGFFILLPIVLMIDYWGDERLTFRGRPIQRDWRPQVTHPPRHDDAGH